MTKEERLSPRIQELLGKPWLAPTGRIKSYLNHPERKTNAPSCMLRVYNNDLGAELAAVSHYLRKGAGVKVQLEKFEARSPLAVQWCFVLPEHHTDFHKINDHHRQFYKPYGWLPEEYRISKERGIEENYPVTAIIVEDNMESIEASWKEFILAAERGDFVLVDLSKLRPAGRSSASGIVSTGVFGLSEGDEGFVSVYEWLADHLRAGDIGTLLRLLGGLCKVLARGGLHKNGIVTTAMDYRSPYILSYLNFPLTEVLGGSKKGVRFDEGILKNPSLCDLVIDCVNYESLFLEKITNEQLYLNVCQGINLKHTASCLVSHANAGQCRTPQDLVTALCDITDFLCLLHTEWRNRTNADPNLYLPLAQDRQVGVGWLGWANFLSIQGVTYAKHVEWLTKVRIYYEGSVVEPLEPQTPEDFKALEIAECLWNAYEAAAGIARSFELERAFTIEPTQRCYKDYEDLYEHTTCRNIDPPFSQWVTRSSEVHGDETFYHGEVETIAEIGHDLHQKHWEEWMYIMQSTGLAHAMSFDLYKKIDYAWFEDFVLRSPLISTYYQQQHKVDQSYLDKGTAFVACDIANPAECSVCGE